MTVPDRTRNPMLRPVSGINIASLMNKEADSAELCCYYAGHMYRLGFVRSYVEDNPRASKGSFY